MIGRSDPGSATGADRVRVSAEREPSGPWLAAYLRPSRHRSRTHFEWPHFCSPSRLVPRGLAGSPCYSERSISRRRHRVVSRRRLRKRWLRVRNYSWESRPRPDWSSSAQAALKRLNVIGVACRGAPLEALIGCSMDRLRRSYDSHEISLDQRATCWQLSHEAVKRTVANSSPDREPPKKSGENDQVNSGNTGLDFVLGAAVGDPHADSEEAGYAALG